MDWDHPAAKILFAKYKGCVQEHHFQSFRLGDRPTDEQADYDRARLDPEFARDFITRRHLVEIIADQWATWNVAEILAEHPKWSRTNKLDFLRDSWSMLCGSEEDGIHPSGQYRINTILGKDPDIRKIMGCGPIPARESPGCTLSGATREPSK